jgi:hypothetical protein
MDFLLFPDNKSDKLSLTFMDLMLLYYNVWKIKSSKSVEGVGLIVPLLVSGRQKEPVPAVDTIYSIREEQPSAESGSRFCMVSNFPPEFSC